VERGGASPLEALQMATIASARILGLEAMIGAVEAGFAADMVVLESNPLEDVTATRRIALVVHDGRMRRPAR
jgi:imidazolonepropionase-like amidohydrolase